MKVYYAQTPTGHILYTDIINHPHNAMAFCVTSDGVNWAYQPFRSVMPPQLYKYRVDTTLRWFVSTNQARLDPVALNMFRWGLHIAKNAAYAADEHSTPALPLSAGVTATMESLGLAIISYGYQENVGRNSTRTEADVVRLVSEAVRHCHDVWGWSPAPKLEIHYMRAGNAMGLAYDTGRGKDSGVRRIALKKTLIRDFDDLALRRVVMHELCHHYRDESYHVGRDHHDYTFSEMLRKVDPLVKENAKFFSYSENTMVASAAAAVANRKDKVVWTADAGMLAVLVTASRTLSLRWVPKPELPKNLRWKPAPVWGADGTLVDFARRFSRTDRHRVRVEFDEGDRTQRWVAGSLDKEVRALNQPISMIYNAQGFLLVYCAMISPKTQAVTYEFLKQESKS